MHTNSNWLKGTIAVSAFVILGLGTAAAQTVAPTPPAPPKAAAPMQQPAPVVKAPAKTAAPAAVVCKGMAEDKCKSETGKCDWVIPTKANPAGKVQSAYCRAVAGVAKKAAKSAATATTPATPPPAKKN